MATPEKLKSGRWKVRFRHGLNKKGDGPGETSETFDTRKKADEFAGWLKALGPQGALDKLYADEQAARVPTLDEVAADHVEHLEAGEGHKIAQGRLWKRTWGPRIGDVRADQINRDQIIKALSDLAHNGKAPGRGYAPKSLNNQRGLLFGVLERCVEEGHLHKHPGRRLKLPEATYAVEFAEDNDDPDEMVCMTLNEYRHLHAAIPDRYQPLVQTAVGTGLRWGELVVLRRRDFNTDATEVSVRRALKWSPDGNHRIGPPKTKRSRRTIAVPGQVSEVVLPLLEGLGQNDLVFTASRGGMLQHRTFWSDIWKPAIWKAQHCDEHTDPGCKCGAGRLRRCKVHEATPPPCGCAGTLMQSPRFHDLRHTHASWLLARGIPIHVVSARLGHKSTSTTYDTYVHLMPDSQLVAASAAAMVFAETSSTQLGASGAPQVLSV